ncbi:MAG: hypothetical protein LBV46_03360, partial [Bacteroidales bacterium]|nr:hypothetical protein [Bacteroidales bacterium]
MKNKFIPYLIFGSLVIGFVACRNSNAFDFSRLSDIEAGGEWGIPLLKNNRYDINTIFDQLNANDLIQQDANGNLFYHLELEEHSFSDSALLSFSPRTISKIVDFENIIIPNGTWNIPQPLSFQLDTTSIIVENGVVKRGTLSIQLNHDLDVGRYHLQLTCPNIELPSGSTFSQVVNTSNPNFRINLAGYKITPSPNNRFNILISIVSTGGGISISSYQLDFHLSLENLMMKSVYGRVRVFSSHFSEFLALK